MSDEFRPSINFGRWKRAPWDRKLLLPEKWADDELPPEGRGPFHTIHCSDEAWADVVLEALNSRVLSGCTQTAREAQ